MEDVTPGRRGLTYKNIEYAAARVMTGTARVVMTAMVSGAANGANPFGPKTETRGETETSRGILFGLGMLIESICLTLIGAAAGILRAWRLATFFW
jgi:hypothetical protein